MDIFGHHRNDPVHDVFQRLRQRWLPRFGISRYLSELNGFSQGSFHTRGGEALFLLQAAPQPMLAKDRATLI